MGLVLVSKSETKEEYGPLDGRDKGNHEGSLEYYTLEQYQNVDI